MPHFVLSLWRDLSRVLLQGLIEQRQSMFLVLPPAHSLDMWSYFPVLTPSLSYDYHQLTQRISGAAEPPLLNLQPSYCLAHQYNAVLFYQDSTRGPSLFQK